MMSCIGAVSGAAAEGQGTCAGFWWLLKPCHQILVKHLLKPGECVCHCSCGHSAELCRASHQRSNWRLDPGTIACAFVPFDQLRSNGLDDRPLQLSGAGRKEVWAPGRPERHQRRKEMRRRGCPRGLPAIYGSSRLYTNVWHYSRFNGRVRIGLCLQLCSRGAVDGRGTHFRAALSTQL